MTYTLESIARGEVDAVAARSEIERHIQTTRDFAKPYSALLRWTWLALSERRADDDLRHWHRLILDIAARAGQGGGADTSATLAERLRALSDIIRVSIGLQTRPDKARLLTRAHVPAILEALDERQPDAVARDDLLEAVALKTANLSRILTLLTLEGLVERQADGRKARYRITGEGRNHLRQHQERTRAPVAEAHSADAVAASPTTNPATNPACAPVVTRMKRRAKAAEPPSPDPELIKAFIKAVKRGRHGGKKRDTQKMRLYGGPDPAKAARQALIAAERAGAGFDAPAKGFNFQPGDHVQIKGEPTGGPIGLGLSPKALLPVAAVGQTRPVSGVQPSEPGGPEYTAFEALAGIKVSEKAANG